MKRKATMKATFKINNDGTIKVLHTGETGKYAEGLAYSVNPLVNPDGGSCCAITGIGTFDGEELNIPPEIDGLKVTRISCYAFRGCTHLTSVTIPASVKSIDDCAFGDCFLLTSVTIPANVRSISGSAFYNCLSLTSVTIDFTGTKSQWESVDKVDGWDLGVGSYIVRCTNGNI